MPQITTHLHLAKLLSQRISINHTTSFLLGNAYPDCWQQSISQSLKLHYKQADDSNCSLSEFLTHNHLDDFHFGYYFHLWTDNYMLHIDTLNISKQDSLICDREVIQPLLIELMNLELRNPKEQQAMENIRLLESKPLSLYLVSLDKNQQYLEILEQCVKTFLDENQQILQNI